MIRFLQVIGGAARAELTQLSRSPLLVALTVVQAVTFLFLVSLFGMTGAMAPTAVINHDLGGRAGAFIQDLRLAHNSFAITTTMSEKQAMDALKHGNLVAMISIPKGFSFSIRSRQSTYIKAVVDNIDMDMIEDIQRALPSAIVAYGKRQKLPYIYVNVGETDLIDHDTGFISYLVASSLVLAAFIISCNLSAVAMAREYESHTALLLCLSPSHPLLPLLGRLLATSLFSLGALLPAVGVAVFAYGIVPKHPLEMTAALVTCVLTFACIGAALGVALKHTLPVASVVFGMALPLFLVSGSYEPERFDGNLIWTIAHFSPIYYAVGIVEHAVHGLRVTPESVSLNFIALALWALVFLCVAAFTARRGIVE